MPVAPGTYTLLALHHAEDKPCVFRGFADVAAVEAFIGAENVRDWADTCEILDPDGKLLEAPEPPPSMGR